MVNKSEDYKLRRIFAEICAGFSVCSFNDRTVYFKHLNSIDTLETDYYYDLFYGNAVKDGVFSEEEKLKYLIDNGLWLKSKEESIQTETNNLRELYNNKRKVYSLREIESYKSQIRESENFIANLMNEKYELIGDTAENYAQRQMDLMLVQKSFFKDSIFKEPLYQNEDFKNLVSEEIDSLIDLHRSILKNLSDTNIKQIAIKSFFCNLFYLTESLVDFFGKSISELTKYQVNLLTYGSYFKNILSNAEGIPQDVLNDATKLEEWHSGKVNIEQVINKQDGQDGVVSLVGVSKKELEYYGVNTISGNQHKMSDKVKESGGELSFEDSIKFGFV